MISHYQASMVEWLRTGLVTWPQSCISLCLFVPAVS